MLKNSRAFTLVEVLVSVIIFAFFAGTVSLARSAFENDGALPQQEARRLGQWLTNVMTISNRSGRPFSLVCPGNLTESFIQVEWENPLQTKTYTSLYGCRFVRYQGTSPKSHYVPQWNTLTPTATIKVSRGRAEHYVVISQHGRVRTATKP
jgi:prepilin-type N-terminal cleavage/methylation domain-containing protein